MTYFGFLALFVGLPLVALAALAWWDHRQGRHLPRTLRSWPAWIVAVAHVIVAVVYTTPWDNYLVATRVWWYDPALVVGLTLGWVPIEEYTFFVLQTLLTSLLFAALARRLPHGPLATNSSVASRGVRLAAVSAVSVVWLSSLWMLTLASTAWTYLGLILVWALPPVMLQLAVGADLLWRHRWVVLLTLATSTIYLALADTVAISGGTWTIDPAQSLPLLLGGVLPVEEAVFFFMTNLLVVFGTTLVLEPESEQRIPARMKDWLRARRNRQRQVA